MDRVRDGVRFAMLVNLLLGLATFTAISFFGDKMMLAFTKDPEVTGWQRIFIDHGRILYSYTAA